MYQDGIFGDDYAEFKKRWQKVQGLRAASARPHRPAALKVGALLEGIGNLWRTAEPKAQRRLAKLLFRAVYIDGQTMGRPGIGRPMEWRPEVALLLSFS